VRRWRWWLGAAGLAGVVLVAALALRPGRGVESPAAPAASAPSLYRRDCAVCHGQTGQGDGPGARAVGLRMPDFTDGHAMAAFNDRFLADIIKKGGSPFGRSGAMPAWSMKLSDEEIQALVVFIRSFAGAPPSR